MRNTRDSTINSLSYILIETEKQKRINHGMNGRKIIHSFIYKQKIQRCNDIEKDRSNSKSDFLKTSSISFLSSMQRNDTESENTKSDGYSLSERLSSTRKRGCSETRDSLQSNSTKMAKQKYNRPELKRKRLESEYIELSERIKAEFGK